MIDLSSHLVILSLFAVGLAWVIAVVLKFFETDAGNTFAYVVIFAIILLALFLPSSYRIDLGSMAAWEIYVGMGMSGLSPILKPASQGTALLFFIGGTILLVLGYSTIF